MRIFVAEEVELLISFCKQEFELNSKSSGKSSLREQLELIKKKTGKLPDEYETLLECPAYLSDVWRYFLQLHSKRTSNGFGINAISYSEVLAFCKLKGVYLQPYEVDLIMQLDNVCLDFYAKEQEQDRQKQEDKRKTKHK